jgi:hypothetical protein
MVSVSSPTVDPISKTVPLLHRSFVRPLIVACDGSRLAGGSYEPTNVVGS